MNPPKSSRLLVLTELFLPTKGGTAVWAAEVYKRLGGKDIHIVTADVPGAAEVDAVHPNTLHRLNLKRVPWLKPESLAMYAKFIAKSLALALTHRFDAIHAFRALPEGLAAWIVARLTFRPVVIYAHGEELTTWGRGSKFKTMRFTLRRADKIIANSDFTRNELLNLGVAEARIVQINPGVNTEKYKPGLFCADLTAQIGLQAGEKLVLSVGRLSRRKGFDMVIHSLPGLLDQGLSAHYAIIGIGEDHDYLSGLARDADLSNHVHLLGHVSPEDLPRWYNACDVFIMPNREINGDTEGFGMVFIEAAACGKPTIGGKAGGTGAAIADGMTGLRIDGASVDEVRAALMKLLGDMQLTHSFGNAGRTRAVTEFSWNVVANKTLLLGNALGK